MITLDLARRLQDAGVAWTPANGDCFAIPDRDLDDTVFVVSDMVIEVQHLTSGGLMKFNGTTEWALDSIAQHEVVWLPREEQLRTLLGSAFRSLVPVLEGFAVEVRYDDQSRRHVAPDAECAYAEALLAVLDDTRSSSS